MSWKIDRPLTGDETQEWLDSWRRRLQCARGSERVESTQERTRVRLLLQEAGLVTHMEIGFLVAIEQATADPACEACAEMSREHQARVGHPVVLACLHKIERVLREKGRQWTGQPKRRGPVNKITKRASA